MHRKSVKERKKTLTKLQHEAKEKRVQKKHINQRMLECHVSVAEQQQVESLAGK